MNNISLDFLNSDVVLEETELDELFVNGLQANPPEDMVARIMNAVSVLPQPKPLSQWKDFDFFVADDTYDQLS
ncbi:hypothetical protein [Dictyobacter kobayashii]|uniref:Uncharacterized protein n=1 Tax=Dictyobacter kobayashii TaxID=2014872 RepID=A0A402AXF6_9CHLR|nr:hypothetical protein [Dictyobacter kobayashii]GCE23786.1 hypothetical protein KDK_75860 [Dictyobacter kobayashii]